MHARQAFTEARGIECRWRRSEGQTKTLGEQRVARVLVMRSSNAFANVIERFRRNRVAR
jgi:hypothetical protein